jgi:hypothetical protein
MYIALVLDRSGSMYGSPLHYSKKSYQFVVDQMGSQDLHSIVASMMKSRRLFDQELKSILLEFKFDNQINFERTVIYFDWSFVDVTDGADLCSLTQELQVHFMNDICQLEQPQHLC